MAELRELYQEVILDHNRKPRNFRSLERANRKAEGYNPLCGDHLTVYLQVEGDIVRDVSFTGAGCAISRASASLMTDSVKGKTLAEVKSLFEAFHRMVTSDAEAGCETEGLGKLEVLCGVREFPARIKCASLAWHTLRAAVDAKVEAEPVSTE
jgi:nitrogen fixation NifU-like protein